MFYTKKEIKDEIKEKIKDNFISYEEFKKLKSIDEDEIYYKLQRDLNILRNNLNFKLFNDKYDFYDFFDNISICINPIIEILNKDIEVVDNRYYYSIVNSIYYYEYNNYCFKDVNDLKLYLKQQYQLNHNTKYIIKIDEDDILKIFDYYNEDVDNVFDKIVEDEIYKVYSMISYYKINIKDNIIISTSSSSSYKEITNKIFEDLFDNFIIDKKLSSMITYKDFKLYFDDNLINYINDNYIFEDNILNIDVDEIKDIILIDNIKYHYDDYLNRYYNINDFFKINVEIYNEDNDNIDIVDIEDEDKIIEIIEDKNYIDIEI